MGNSGTGYSSELKTEAVSQVIDRGYSVKDVAKFIGVSVVPCVPLLLPGSHQACTPVHNSGPL